MEHTGNNQQTGVISSLQGAKYHFQIINKILSWNKEYCIKNANIFHWHVRALLWELTACVDLLQNDERIKKEAYFWEKASWYPKLIAMKNMSHQHFNFAEILFNADEVMAVKVALKTGNEVLNISFYDFCQLCMDDIELGINKCYKGIA